MAVCVCDGRTRDTPPHLLRHKMSAARYRLLVAGAALALAAVGCQRRVPPAPVVAQPPPAAAPVYKGYKMAPYKLRGMRFVPMNPDQALRYDKVGLASHYEAHGRRGAIGERLHRGQLYAAHRTLPLPCTARVTNLENGLSCTVRIADRGPYIAGRLIDVSSAVAHRLNFHRNGLARVRVQVLSVGDGQYRRTLSGR